MKKIYITGVAGTGKSTISEALKKRGLISFDVDSVDELCHWRNKVTKEKADYYSGIGKEWLEAHGWVCDKEKLEELLNKYQDNVVVVGITYNQSEYLNLFDKILLLHCTPETLLKRLRDRTTNNFGKDPIEQERILGYSKKFEDKLISKGAIAINTETSIEEVVDQIINNIKN